MLQALEVQVYDLTQKLEVSCPFPDCSHLATKLFHAVHPEFLNIAGV